jgi:hypothetical protein
MDGFGQALLLDSKAGFNRKTIPQMLGDPSKLLKRMQKYFYAEDQFE